MPMDMGMQPDNMDMSMNSGLQDPNQMDGSDPMDDTSMGGDPNTIGGEQGQQNQFDSNFDAGVEADEDADPKKYIQQLTGKLSQKLNSYNSEEGEDPGLSKYVGKMILKQAVKALDDAGRKELIKTINTTDSEDATDEDISGDDIENNTENLDSDVFDNGNNNQMQECKFTKREIKKLNEEINNLLSGREDNLVDNVKKQNFKKSNNPFLGKKF